MSAVPEEKKSRFTFRDLKNLCRSSTSCPLRVIALIDFDAFYAQCEMVRLGLPENQPLGVQQWNMLIAVNYAAKAAGVKRIMSANEAKSICPQIVLQHVATWREGDLNWAYRGDAAQHMRTDKAALDPYRKQSREAFELIRSLLPPSPLQRIEKASIDEVFLDLSAQVYHLMVERYSDKLSDQSNPDCFLPLPPANLLDRESTKTVDLGHENDADHIDWDDVTLHVGAEIIHSIRHQIHLQLRITCSAGVASNKTVAKLAAGHNKPNQQTVVRARSVARFISGYKLTKIRGFARKLGQRVVEVFGTDEIETLLRYTLSEMRQALGDESGTSVYNGIRGIDLSEVVQRTQPKSMLAAKTFVPKANKLEDTENWLRLMAEDLMGRLHEQDEIASPPRRPKVIVLHHAINGRFGPTRSKQMPIPSGVEISSKLLYDLSRELLIQTSHDGATWPCLGLSIAIMQFENCIANNHDIKSFFGPKDADNTTDTHAINESTNSIGSTLATKRKRDSEHFGTQDEIGFTRPLEKRPLSANKKTYLPFLPMTDRDDGEEDCVVDASGSEDFRYRCPKCHQFIESIDVLEHLDWHVAKDLQDD